MKKLVIALLGTFALSAMAETADEAARLFADRLADKENAFKAAEAYKALSAAATSSAEKGVLQTKEAQAIYYYGGQLTDKDKRKSLYTRGKSTAEAAIKTLSASRGVPAQGASATDLALAHYFYAINLGKWGQVNGIAASIGALPDLFKHLEVVESLDNSVEEFGSFRTRGRVKHKVPPFLARTVGLGGFGKEEALDELNQSLENTTVDMPGTGLKVSTNSTNTVYALDVLADLDQRDEFCGLLKGALAMAKAGNDVLAQVNPEKVAEQRNDYNNLVTCLNDVKKCEDVDFHAGKEVNKMAKSCR